MDVPLSCAEGVFTQRPVSMVAAARRNSSSVRTTNHAVDWRMAILTAALLGAALPACADALSAVSTQGRWGPVLPLPLVAVAAAQLPNRKLVLWAAHLGNSAKNGSNQTATAIWDPDTRQAVSSTITNTQHRVVLLPSGDVLVNGGLSNRQTSIYRWQNQSWTSAALMNVGRGYNADTLLPDGRVLTIGGSFSGGIFAKCGEVWSSSSGWKLLPEMSGAAITTQDSGGLWRSDNHAWMFPLPNGNVLHAGPSWDMHILNVTERGSNSSAGFRGAHRDAMNGNAAMWAPYKLLAVGGAPSYVKSNSTNQAYVISIASDSRVSVTQTGPMKYPRALQNSVVLPSGKVFVVGGKLNTNLLWNDSDAVYAPELWDPAAGKFSVMANHTIARGYHSVALLLHDATVFSAGGGLCNCSADHLNLQIYYPPYLFHVNGTRAQQPRITAAPGKATRGSSFPVTVDVPVKSFVAMRLGSVTHSVNNDQRRVPLTATLLPNSKFSYLVEIPTDASVVLPGFYMLFAISSTGVPSVAKSIQIVCTVLPSGKTVCP